MATSARVCYHGYRLFFLRKSFFSGHASFSMYTMLYLVVSVVLLSPQDASLPPLGSKFCFFFLLLPVLPAVPFHLARRAPAAPSDPVHAHHDVLLHRPVPGLGPQAPSHRCPGWFYTGSPGGLLRSEQISFVTLL